MKSDEFVDRRERWVEALEIPVVITGVLILLAAVGYGVGDALLAPVPISRQPGFVDVVLGSRTVVATIRVAVIFAAAFLVVSVVALMRRRQWLIRVGPVEVSEQVADFDIEAKRMDESLENAMQTIDSLRYELAVSNFLLDRSVGRSGGTE